MDPKQLKETHGPEWHIQKAIIHYLRTREWFVQETHGSVYQSGLPDLYCVHYKYRQRWIEVKQPIHYKFTPAQLDKFPIINRVAGIWILTAATEHEYQKLFGPPNWFWFLEAAK